jgi:hypothetical protein
MTPWPSGIEILSPRAGFLIGRGANFTSQFGEDGLIATWLEKFHPANKWCFEVGAADGTYLSNTKLLRSQGWTAVLIEADAEKYETLRTLASPSVFTVPKRIQHNSLDPILEKCGAPKQLDLGVIDIDGWDYWAWDGLREFRPRLMLVEFSFRSEEEAEFVPVHDGAGQANYKAILRLGKDKGYEALVKTHCNILFLDTQ